jgi:RNA polymerase sigma factor (TIGR02999 family)
MTLTQETEVTRLLVAWSHGNETALDQLMPLVYEELHRLAARSMAKERSDHTLQPTALLHEAFFRLVGQDQVHWKNRAQFFGIAAKMMRRILVDHARSRRFAKRQGVEHTIQLDEASIPTQSRPTDLLALDEALEALAHLDARKAQVVDLRVFGGLTIPETAEVLGFSATTVIHEFRTAKAWLYRELRAEDPAEGEGNSLPPGTS